MSFMGPGPAQDLIEFLDGARFGTVLADPPWRFTNRTGKMAPEHKRLAPLARRIDEMRVAEISTNE